MNMISIIACISKDNRAIGYQNRLLYHLPSDMVRFRELTTGHTIVMGRKTFESLPNGALPYRRNIVVSKKSERDRWGRSISYPERSTQGCARRHLVCPQGRCRNSQPGRNLHHWRRKHLSPGASCCPETLSHHRR